MKRINPTGCGYSFVSGQTYTCTAVPKLKDMFRHTYTNAFATTQIHTIYSGADYSDPNWLGNESNLLQGSIDNYAQMPQAFEGFVMTLTPILGMAGSMTEGPEVPELDCRVNFDPFTCANGSVKNTDSSYTAEADTINDGFLDLYNEVESYTPVVNVQLKQEDQLTPVDGGTHQIYYTVPVDYIGGRTASVSGVGQVISGSGVKSLTVGPGILEPMLDTSFPSIGLDTITGPDIIGDFTMWEFNTLSQWQKTVDDRLNNLNIHMPVVSYDTVDGLVNLENAKNQNGGCQNFTITVTGTTTPVKVIGGTSSSSLPIPSYNIAGGTIYINGVGSTVAASAPTVSTFDAYLDVFTSNNVYGATITTTAVETQPISTVPTGVDFQHKKFVYIGSVTNVISTKGVPINGGSVFSLYRIRQGDCITDVTVHEAFEEDPYLGPYLVEYRAAASGQPAGLYVTGFDGTNEAVKAGKVYIDGETVSLVAEGAVSGSSGDMVYAHVTLNYLGPTAGYEFAACTFDRTETAEDPGENKRVYTVRLARLTGADLTEPEQIHYGDIYIDTSVEAAPEGNNLYRGPFRVETVSAGTESQEVLEVRGIYFDDLISSNVSAAGRIVIDGSTITSAAPARVAHSVAATPFDVYLNVELAPVIDSTTSEITGYTVADYDYDRLMRIAPTTAGNKVYSVRLARITAGSGSAYVQQTHFGDVYIDSSADTGTVVDEGYNGPFKVSCTDNVVSVDVLPSTDIAGAVFFNGLSAGTAPAKTNVVTLQNQAKQVYAAILVSYASSTPTATVNYVTEIPASVPNNTYYVLLADVSATGEVTQRQYGDLYAFGASSYDGPFQVACSNGTISIPAFATEDSTDIAGYIFYNDTKVGVGGTTSTVVQTGSGVQHVYASVVLDPASEPVTPAVTYVTSPVAATNTHFILLADVSGNVVTQRHFGDIYLYSAEAPETYSGPFQVQCTDGTTSVVKLYETANVAGVVFYNGTSIGVGASTVMPGTTGDYSVYANVTVTEGDPSATPATQTTASVAYNTTASTAADGVYSVLLADIKSNVVVQRHFGDIYLYHSAEGTATPAYRGPFTVTSTGLSCPICTPETDKTVIGYFRINGGTRVSVYSTDVSVTYAANTATNVYIHVTDLTTAIVNTSATYSNQQNPSAPPAYTVWLGQVTKDANGIVTDIDQVHYGEVLVDGRWS